MTRKRLHDAVDPRLLPPEELRALCSMCDVKTEYIYGRPGHAWRLSVSGKPSITLQSVVYDDWNEAVKKLVS